MKAPRSAEIGPLPNVRIDRARQDALFLDTENPRLVQYGLSPTTSQGEVVELLWKHMSVEEVAMSIAAQGYWDYETMLVVNENGRDVVIEGNRRLAAIRLLLDSKLRRKVGATDLPSLSEGDRTKLQSQEIPILRLEKRQDAWRYLGFKHVNGPARWASYAKAKYIAFVHNTAGVSLDEIARQIGDTHRTVQRLYRALMVIEQAEREGVWHRKYCYKNQLAFSHLMTALDYPEFASYLAISDARAESPSPVARDRLRDLKEVCTWLWGDSRDDRPPVVRSQNPHLRMLISIMAEPTKSAVHALRRGESIETAYDISKGDETVFGEALQDAKQALMRAQARVSTGYTGRSDEKHLLQMAKDVAEMADDLLTTMQSRETAARSPKLLHR